MKAALLFISLFALSMLIIPLLLSQRPGVSQSPPPGAAVEGLSDIQQPPPKEPAAITEGPAQSPGDKPYPQVAHEFRILDETTGEIHTISAGDFVRGAVAAEMPARFHPEALKAQAVAAHTYALRRQLLEAANPNPSLKGADFSADPGNMLVYITEEKAREFYGHAADEYWPKICEAADSVLNLVLFYEEEPIVAAYHAMSAGSTEDAANVWVGGAPYLIPAKSAGDLLAPDYETSRRFSAEEARSLLRAEYPDMELGGDPGGWFGEITLSPSGYTTKVVVGGEPLRGSDIRRIFGLRSHSFDILTDDNGVAFVVRGYGHGVGLSQYGADFMARQGHSFSEILETYYVGAELRVLAG